MTQGSIMVPMKVGVAGFEDSSVVEIDSVEVHSLASFPGAAAAGSGASRIEVAGEDEHLSSAITVAGPGSGPRSIHGDGLQGNQGTEALSSDVFGLH